MRWFMAGFAPTKNFYADASKQIVDHWPSTEKQGNMLENSIFVISKYT
jgi:hypothetical protein